MKNKKNLLIFLMLVLLVLSACVKTEDPDPVVYQTADESSSGVVIADGEVVPAQEVQLVSQMTGYVDQVMVAEGQTVRAGDVLFRLEDQEDLLAQLEGAKLEELSAQQAVDDLFLYAGTEKNQLYQQILETQTLLNTAEKAWDDFDKDQYEDDLENAKEKIADAKQKLEDAEDDLADYLDLDEENATRKSREDAVEKAEIELNDAERERDELEQTYDQLQLNLDVAEETLAVLQAEYNQYKDGPDTDKLAAAEQRLQTAQSNVQALQATIAKLEITAPFDGTIAMLDISDGDFVHAGQVVGRLADFSAWFVETTDLNELEVVRIQVGDTVSIELDAFPDQTLTGTVIQIKEYAELKYSDVIYPVRIQLDPTDVDLRWKMTALVRFNR